MNKTKPQGNARNMDMMYTNIKQETNFQSHQSFQAFTQRLDLVFRERCDPKTPFNYAVDRLQRVLVACVNQTKQAFDNPGGGTVPFEVDKRVSITGACDL